MGDPFSTMMVVLGILALVLAAIGGLFPDSPRVSAFLFTATLMLLFSLIVAAILGGTQCLTGSNTTSL